MRNKFILVTLIVYAKFMLGQNLVPNYSFETYTACPNAASQINLATPWYGPTSNSTDYLNYCSPTRNPSAGTQSPRTGNGYASMWFYNPGMTDYKEYLQVELTDTLRSNTCYYVEFYVNLVNGVRFGVNNIGAHLSNQAIWTTGTGYYLNIAPHILLPGNPIITDTVNWTRISGTYTALGGEKFITIGNFFSDANTDTLAIQGFPYYFGSYYNIEDVSVVDCSSVGINEINSNINVQISPNPFSSETIIQTNRNLKNANLIVYNSIGQIVKQIKNLSGQTVTLSRDNLPNGLYFIRFTENNKIAVVDKLVIAD
jgi:hypothetical protein